MAHSFAQMRRNFWALFGRFQPYFFKFCYYFAIPSIFVYGKSPRTTIMSILTSTLVPGCMIKPRSPIVDAMLEFIGLVEPKPAFNPYAGGPPMGMM